MSPEVLQDSPEVSGGLVGASEENGSLFGILGCSLISGVLSSDDLSDQHGVLRGDDLVLLRDDLALLGKIVALRGRV